MAIRSEVPNNNRRRRGSALEMFTVGMCALMVLLIAFLIIVSETRAERTQSQGRMRATATLAQAYVHEQTSGLAALVVSYGDRVAASGAPAGRWNDTAARVAATTDLRHLDEARPEIIVSFLTDARGVLLGVQPPAPGQIGKSFAFRDWYRGALAARGAYISEAYQSRSVGKPFVIATSTVVRSRSSAGRQGPVLGVLAATIALSSFQRFVQDYSARTGITLLIVDQRGVLIADGGHPVRPGTALEDRRAAGGRALAARGAISASIKDPGTGWTVISEVPTDVGLAATAAFRRIVMIAAVLLMLLIFGGAAAAGRVRENRRISERKIAESEERVESQRQRVTEQRQASQYARSLLEAALDPLVTINPDGKITDVNDATAKVTGVPRQELVGTDFSGYFTDPAKANEGYQQVFAQGQVTDYPLTLRHRDGRLTEVLYNASVYRDPDGNVLGVFAAARDVTEQRHIERTLEDKNVQLEHASQMKSEFLATMSHELRTPLNSVIGFSEALKDGLVGDLAQVQQEYVGDIFASGQHLLSLINDILDLSKVEAGMMDVQMEAVDVKMLLSNSLSIVRDKAAARSIRVDLVFDERVGVAHLDPRKTKQIVYNLLSNAVKFSGQGGLVSMRARYVPRSTVGTLEGTWPVRRFELADNGFTAFLEISVTDGGIGISEENTAKLFQAFTQIDSTLARKFEGTGLGLAMVKQLTELLGGTVAVASREGEGACFAAWVPLRGTSAQSTFTEHGDLRVDKVAAPEVQERVALVVEDDDKAADLVRILLEAEGFAVVRASGTEEAREMAPQQSLDLITVDIPLPGIDGWQFITGIREDANLGTVPVVVISGAPDGPPVALAGGAITVLQKPVSHAALKKALTYIGLHENQDRTRTVLVVDDDPKAVELIAAFLPTPAYATVRAYGGQEAIVLARRLRPDLILLDLMMPEVSGFDVVHALSCEPSTSGIPILILTAKQVTAADCEVLNTGPNHVIHVIKKAGFNRVHFLAEVRRALR